MVESCLDVLIHWGFKANEELRVNMEDVTPAGYETFCLHKTRGVMDIKVDRPRFESLDDVRAKPLGNPCLSSHFKNQPLSQADRTFSELVNHVELASLLRLVEIETKVRVKAILFDPLALGCEADLRGAPTMRRIRPELELLAGTYGVPMLKEMLEEYTFSALRKASADLPGRFLNNFGLRKAAKTEPLAYFQAGGGGLDAHFLLKESFSHIRGFSQMDRDPTNFFLMPASMITDEVKRRELDTQGMTNINQNCTPLECLPNLRNKLPRLYLSAAYLYPQIEEQDQIEFQETLKVLALERDFSSALKAASALARS